MMHVLRYLVEWHSGPHYQTVTIVPSGEERRLLAFRRVTESYWMVPGTGTEED
jgi:hypothetical protein